MTLAEIKDLLTEILRWLAASFALISCIYSVRFIVRYAKVNWEKSPWGRHVMRFSRLIAVATGTAVVLRLAALLGFTDQFLLALIGAVIYGWVAYEMRRRYWLERETQQQRAAEKAAQQKETGNHD